MQDKYKELKEYSVTITAEIANSLSLRKLLRENGFSIYLYNRITGEFSSAPNDDKVETILPCFSEFSYRFICRYTDFSKPIANELFQTLNTHPSIKSYSVSLRTYATEEYFPQT